MSDHKFLADPTELAAGFFFMALESLKQADLKGCLEVAHRLDLAAARETNKRLQNAYLRAAESARHVAVSKDPSALERWKNTRHTSKP